MRKRQNRGIYVLLMFFVLGAPSLIHAQDDTTPRPYTVEEFDPWLHAVRRSTIIAIGAVPITLFFSNLIYDIIRFSVKSVEIGGINNTYAPLFFAPPGKPAFTSEEQLGIVVASLITAVVISVVDAIIIAVEEESVTPRLLE